MHPYTRSPRNGATLFRLLPPGVAFYISADQLKFSSLRSQKLLPRIPEKQVAAGASLGFRFLRLRLAAVIHHHVSGPEEWMIGLQVVIPPRLVDARFEFRIQPPIGR